MLHERESESPLVEAGPVEGMMQDEEEESEQDE
jgi:hypothetical protein